MRRRCSRSGAPCDVVILTDALVAELMESGHLLPGSAKNVGVVKTGVVFGSVTIASLVSGGLMNCSGGSPIEGWTAVNLAMIPFLALAGSALIWLTMRPSAT